MSYHSRAADQAETESVQMRVVKNFGVSCLSASLAHIPHHPLYTLKSQMMYYGKEFRFTSFVRRAWNTRGLFLFQGKW
jgi:hypothetical protein